MVIQLLGLAFLCLTMSPVTFRAQALQINHTGEVVYHDARVYGVVDQAAILECGSTLPDVYMWSFTQPGSGTIKAVVYDLGRGPRFQKLAETLGRPRLIPDSAAVSIEKLPLAAHGLFTCQAFYDTEQEAVVHYNYVHLTVRVPVSKPSLLVSNGSPVEGSTMWLRCSVDNGTEPVRYLWQHEDQNRSITNFTDGTSSIVNVTSVARNHTGWYRCVASNAVNTESSDRLWLDIMFGPDAPQMVVTPSRTAERGYSALEGETVSLLCQAQSNPASRYLWFYNNSQVHTGPQYTITEILRLHTGDYSCLAENSYLNTSAMETISLTVYYPPDGPPSCSVEPALNHSSLSLLCSWPGGFPPPSLHWTGDLVPAGQHQAETGQHSNILLPSGGLNANSSSFTCRGSHPALERPAQCSAHTYLPSAEPLCAANVTDDRQLLILSCSWDGGVPAALVWWEGPGVQSRGAQGNSSILVLPYGAAQHQKPYDCHAQHPLLARPKSCSLTLVPVSKPHLLLSDAPVEGSTIWMHCIVGNGTGPIQYEWQRETSWGNYTTFSEGGEDIIRMTDINRTHSGGYRCAASNAVSSEDSDPIWVDAIFGPDAPQMVVTPSRTAERGYLALEGETVSLLCQAQSNPASRYLWFYNNSQVHTGPQYTITKILRMHTGDYSCLAENSYLNTSAMETISLTVYYPPGGSPSCSVEPALNHSSLRLLCSWPGGAPPPSLHWSGELIPAGRGQDDTRQQTHQLSNVLLPVGGLSPASSSFTCRGSHPALEQVTECTTHINLPSAEPQCFANVTNDKQHVILSCSWDGGAPKALLWWGAPAGLSDGRGEDFSTLVLNYSTFHFGEPYTCHAKHPLLVQTRTCSLTLVPVSQPRLTTSDASPLEGSKVLMGCRVENGTEPVRYAWRHQTSGGAITTVAEGSSDLLNFSLAEVNFRVKRSHTGWYRCEASNAVNTARSEPLWLDAVFGPDAPQIAVTPSRTAERGYSALEGETVSLLCQAQSNPASRYLWFYNNSQVHTGPQYTITEILRLHTGDYACLAQNTHLNTRSRKTIRLTVYYPPDGPPSCSVEPALNHSSLRLLCSWPGGFPPPSLHWTGDLVPAGPGPDPDPDLHTLLLPSEGLIPNSIFTCRGQHPALEEPVECSTSTYVPASEPVCFAYVTNDKQHLILSCSWSGGAPRALLWWEGPGGHSKAGEESSNVLVLGYGAARSGEPYTCHAQHPLLARPQTCRLTLEAPVLLTQRRRVSVYEGTDVQLTCNLRANYLPASDITWLNNRGSDVRDPSKYTLLQTSAWANLTVRDADETQDSGDYRCSTSNAVGGAEVNVTLVVKKHPAPPNVTLLRAAYVGPRRDQVQLEWRVETEQDGGWTGFVSEHRWVSERPGRRKSSNGSEEQNGERTGLKDWYRTIIPDPDLRSHTVRGLTPTVTYQFRVTPLNHRTIGHPSAAKSPGELRKGVYPAVVGAAVGGMLFAAVATALLLLYISRNRNNNPRLHDMLFGLQHSPSRENINFPEDEVGGAEEEAGSSSPGPPMASPPPSSLSATH